ncbi:Alcohol dehydrogenase / Acetaldehyde dehydrogenase (acetylating) [Bacillus thuringiensis serovar israelensis ATCC 35646]|nr:Alcohol dehydrogenase / Acetaldehyde dehydrogenase (acetylating) [Bacillus thuringiensis serovar israelensis ATCC 35646]
MDNGMICASEQAIIVDKEIYDDVKTEMIENNCYFVTEEERKKLEKLVINENTCAVNSDIVGKSAQYIAELVGITVPEHTKMLVAEIQGIGAAYPLSREKLSPVLACVKANSLEKGFTYCEEMLNLGGLGHSAVIHSTNKEVQKQFGLRMKACRLIVNAPSSQGGIGDIYNGFIPSLTLGCGSYGKNSVSQNVTATHLLNIKRLANRKKNMQWFKLPPKIYFEKLLQRNLANMPNIYMLHFFVPGFLEWLNMAMWEYSHALFKQACK